MCDVRLAKSFKASSPTANAASFKLNVGARVVGGGLSTALAEFVVEGLENDEGLSSGTGGFDLPLSLGVSGLPNWFDPGEELNCVFFMAFK